VHFSIPDHEKDERAKTTGPAEVSKSRASLGLSSIYGK
jgi:hypothetical protein